MNANYVDSGSSTWLTSNSGRGESRIWIVCFTSYSIKLQNFLSFGQDAGEIENKGRLVLKPSNFESGIYLTRRISS